MIWFHRKNSKKYLKRVIIREAIITLKSISILIVLGCLGFLYAYQSVYILRTGYSIKAKEQKVDEVTQQVLNLKVVISKIESPEFVKKKIVEHGLNLNPCDEDSIVRVSDEKEQI